MNPDPNGPIWNDTNPCPECGAPSIDVDCAPGFWLRLICSACWHEWKVRL